MGPIDTVRYSCTNNRNNKRDDSNQASLVVQLSTEVVENDSRQRSNNTSWDSHQGRLLGVETKIVDDDTRESVQTTIRNINTDVEKEHNVGLWLQESFFDLVPLKVVGFNTGLVLQHSFGHDESFFVVKVNGIHGRRGQEEEHNNGPQERNRTDQKEQGFPSRNRLAKVTHQPGQEAIDDRRTEHENKT